MPVRPGFLPVRPAPLDVRACGRDRGSVTDQDRGTTYPWTPGEPLAEVLHLLRMRGVFYCRSEVSAPWALEMPAFEDCASFHVVVSGEAVLDVPRADENAVRLVPGDLAVVPHGAGHVIRSEPAPLHAGRVDLLPQEMIGEHCSVLRYGGGGDRTVLVCGIVEFGHPTARRLMRSLPPVLRSGTAAASRGGAVRFLLDLMAEEAARMRPGGEAVLTRLADVLVILAMREWMDSGAADRSGWLLALRDPHIGRALAAVHRAPEHPWTVASLAHEAAMSRSAFAARFTDLVGEPAMQYVTRWRMESALTALREGASVAELAARSGYESEAAFARAFKRMTGLTPGSARRAVPNATTPR